MEPFVQQLAALCASHPTRAKWVFVPSHHIGRTIGDRLVLGGTEWANLRFVTPFGMALHMGAPFLVERGIDPSEEGLGPALMMSLLLGLPESRGEGGYFRPLAHQPELARALWSTVTELRMAGLGPDDLKANAFESSVKHEELKSLLTAYETYLATTNRGDRATVFGEAVKHPDWCPIQKQDCWTELPDTIWSPLERRLIDSMPGERMTPETLALSGTALPRRLATSSVTRLQARNAPLAHLLEPGTWNPEPGTRNPERGTRNPEPKALFFQAGGSEAEVEEVFRRILASGQPLDQIEICSASPSSPSLVWEKCLRYEWPVTMESGIDAAMTRPGRALVAFAEWIEDDFSAGKLRKLLQSGDVRVTVKDDSLSSGTAARLLIKAQAAWGRETYRLALGRLARSSRTAADRDDLDADARDGLKKRADQSDALAAWIESIIDAVPAEGADLKVDLQQLVRCAVTFITEHAASASALDHAAALGIAGALKELEALGDFRCPLAEGLRFLGERADSVTVGADRPRPGHLHVSTLRRAGLSHRRQLFVVGLEEGRIFPSSFEDPILLDNERAAISDALVRANDRIDEAVFAALSRLAAVSANDNVAMTLSYSCRDLREFRETHASWLILQAYRIASGNPTARFSDLHDHMGAPKSCVPETPARALGASRWWLHGVTRAGHQARPAVLGHYASLARGQHAQDTRASAQFTEFDGHVPAAGSILDPASPDRVVSPTQLEDAASCPYRYFLRRGLGIAAIESGDRAREVWLNPLLRGSMLHDLYAGLMRHCRKEKRGVTSADTDWLLVEGKRVLAELASEMPPPSADVGDRETQDVLADLELFAKAEADAAKAGAQPLAFEVAFGRGEPDEDEPLSRLEPITVDLGGGAKIRIAGRIDRIDQIVQSGSGSKATFEIIDYKTGSYYAPAWEGTFAGGSRLQHALYGLAAIEILKAVHKSPKMSAATYYFSSAKGRQHRKQIAAQSAAKVTEVLSDLRGIIKDGLFIHAHNEEACSFCDYGYACGKNAHATAENKHADPALAPFLKLVRHE
jgi:ATP-dependent helicase/nuclease subunit B